jgi:hypothetical protein
MALRRARSDRGRPRCGGCALLQCALRQAGVVTQAREDDEWRKRITALFGEGHAAIPIDNIARPLDSGVLAAALTATWWTDRLPGRNDTVSVPGRCAWVLTANNPVTTTEVARRLIRVRLDPRMDRPGSGRASDMPTRVAGRATSGRTWCGPPSRWCRCGSPPGDPAFRTGRWARSRGVVRRHGRHPGARRHPRLPVPWQRPSMASASAGG